jgi:hypothetical protein
VAIVALVFRWRDAPVRVLAQAVSEAPTLSGETDPLGALDALLAELESATVRVDGADELEAAAAALEGVR